MKMESFPQPDAWTVEDIQQELQVSDPELFRYIKLLPTQLWARHFNELQEIEKKLADRPDAIREAKINYILGIVESREQAIETFESHDLELRSEPSHIWRDRLRSLLVAEGNNLGAGMTARIKSLRLENRPDPIAVKYLLTPTAKTLSVDAEYELSREVEIITDVEIAENRTRAHERISLPHPLFNYKRGPLQCYGMAQIDGLTLEQLTAKTGISESQKDAIISAIQERYETDDAIQALFEEVDEFMIAMHQVCLHGDIKLANVMIDTHAKLYLIDFGQAVRMQEMSEKTREQFENLQAHERDQMRECVKSLIHTSNTRETYAEAA